MKIVIIGNGIAGSTAARFIRKNSDHEIVMISSESMHPFSRTALMYIFMGHMKFEHTKLYEDGFWSKNRIQLIKDKVLNIDANNKSITLENQNLSYDKLIIATGSKSNKFGWPGQDLDGVQGLYHLSDLETMEAKTSKGIKHAVIVGGGLIGIEMAEMFHSRNISVTLLVREASFWNIVLPQEESEMVSNHILSHGVDLRLSTEMDAILPDDNEKVGGVRLKNQEELTCNFVGLTVGVSPNIEFVKSSTIKTNKGIIVNEFLQTNHEDIYAIGDCAELSMPSEGRRAIEAVWYTGRMMGIACANNICNKPSKYNPGIWYNSAKFFDVEYQVYGYVPTTPQANFQSIFWQHKSQNKSIRVVYNINNEVVGFNLMGIRYRHEVCEQWIKNKTQIVDVMQNLSLANFDPEFFEEYEAELLEIYNKTATTKVQLKSKRKLSLVQKFLEKIN